jgi:hypothetical protein
MIISGIVSMPEWQGDKDNSWRPCISIVREGDYVLIAPCSTNSQAKGTAINLTTPRARLCGFAKGCSIVMTELVWKHIDDFKRVGSVPVGTRNKISSWILEHKVSTPFA